MNGKKTLLSGITATGKLTLGNYIGAIKNMVKMQEQYDSYIFVADLHALTIPIDPKTLAKNRNDIFSLYLACGLDPEKSTIFFQSDVIENGVMNWYVLTNTTIGELSRMTQYKDKSAKVKSANGMETIPTGLLIYPTLMASDILLYNADVVPVGIDQKQHVELARNLAQRLNNKYKVDFKIPEAIIPKVGAKIMSLVEPTKKMSKSDDNPKSAIYLLDDPDEAYKKIIKSVTDSEGKIYISENKPGITNLLTIYSALKEISLLEAENIFKDKNYGELKIAVATVVKEFLTNIQEKYHRIIAQLDKYRELGANKASKIAKENLKKLTKGIGLN
ncbi:tryptophan--tRNA ligase [Metamycoplasma arthritidis]|uniref:Tryptophan--tRNA ligase n=1 Tax=Metamycoplasma arthritidis (strain 158L3-1) TaxID=243272 RepID=B3PN66_META1|nr:tryptophan--tRNA ligase [Metamycoplasma arthritidis]ACF07468.1 tryptophanyl-tRNA synthetase [Metamycoplasma arthritidis 158L3-1]VEU78989.1 tryptophan--tRNA ligase [Metamycoplasma arthritidis]